MLRHDVIDAKGRHVGQLNDVANLCLATFISGGRGVSPVMDRRSLGRAVCASSGRAGSARGTGAHTIAHRAITGPGWLTHGSLVRSGSPRRPRPMTCRMARARGPPSSRRHAPPKPFAPARRAAALAQRCGGCAGPGTVVQWLAAVGPGCRAHGAGGAASGATQHRGAAAAAVDAGTERRPRRRGAARSHQRLFNRRVDLSHGRREVWGEADHWASPLEMLGRATAIARTTRSPSTSAWSRWACRWRGCAWCTCARRSAATTRRRTWCWRTTPQPDAEPLILDNLVDERAPGLAPARPDAGIQLQQRGPVARRRRAKRGRSAGAAVALARGVGQGARRGISVMQA